MSFKSTLLGKKKSPELLWKQFTKGDMAAFRKIYETNYQKLFNLGLQFVSQSEVEDCIQNLFLYILGKRKSITKVKNVEAYLYISLRNQIIKTNKKKQFDFQQLDATLINEQTSYKKESIVSEIKRLLQKLSPRENEIIHMRYYQGFKSYEIADALDIEYQTVRNTLANALKKMRKTPFQIFS